MLTISRLYPFVNGENKNERNTPVGKENPKSSGGSESKEISTTQNPPKTSKKDGKKKEDNRKEKRKAKCIFCDSDNHMAWNCESDISVEEKKEKLRKNERCTACMKRFHREEDCKLQVEATL